MSSLNKLKNTLTDVASVTAEKTEELIKQTKIRAHIAETQRRLSKTYMEIGKLMSMDDSEKDDSFDLTLAHHIQKARQLKILLMQRKNELKKAKQSLICPSCMKTTSIDHLFCPKCGTALLNKEEYLS